VSEEKLNSFIAPHHVCEFVNARSSQVRRAADSPSNARVVLFSNQSSNFPLCACVCKAVDGITSAFIIRAIPQLIPTLPGTRARSFTGGGGGGDGGG
jgi:hypothetical protein